MNPLAIEIWLYILAAYVVVSLTIYIVARFSPYEWREAWQCGAAARAAAMAASSQDGLLDPPMPMLPPAQLNAARLMENCFTLGNSFWFTIGTLMQQGSDLNPKVGGGQVGTCDVCKAA